MTFDAETEGALLLLARIRPEASRLLREQLTVKSPNANLIDDLRLAASTIRNNCNNCNNKDLANRLSKHAESLIL